MRKIPTLFVRDEQDRSRVTDQITPGCEWVLAGEGIATRKYDGTCVRLDVNGYWWARREVKRGKVPPPGWLLVSTDETTGKSVGWEPIEQSSFARWHAEALAGRTADDFEPGTYELIGPKVNGNREQVDGHILVRHALAQRVAMPGGQLSYSALVATVRSNAATEGWEGIVWHHPDGRMTKLKARDVRS